VSVHVHHDPATDYLPGFITASQTDGLDRVDVRIRYDGKHGTRKALFMLALASIDVVVAARSARGEVHADG
jgi:hypothetical protein